MLSARAVARESFCAWVGARPLLRAASGMSAVLLSPIEAVDGGTEREGAISRDGFITNQMAVASAAATASPPTRIVHVWRRGRGGRSGRDARAGTELVVLRAEAGAGWFASTASIVRVRLLPPCCDLMRSRFLRALVGRIEEENASEFQRRVVEMVLPLCRKNVPRERQWATVFSRMAASYASGFLMYELSRRRSRAIWLFHRRFQVGDQCGRVRIAVAVVLLQHARDDGVELGFDDGLMWVTDTGAKV